MSRPLCALSHGRHGHCSRHGHRALRSPPHPTPVRLGNQKYPGCPGVSGRRGRVAGRSTTTTSPGLNSRPFTEPQDLQVREENRAARYFFIVIINLQEATSPGKTLQKLEPKKCFVASWMELTSLVLGTCLTFK